MSKQVKYNQPCKLSSIQPDHCLIGDRLETPRAQNSFFYQSFAEMAIFLSTERI
jgi:hypothetical protein